MWKKCKDNFVSADTILTLGLDGVYRRKHLLFLLSLLTFLTHSVLFKKINIEMKFSIGLPLPNARHASLNAPLIFIYYKRKLTVTEKQVYRIMNWSS